MQAPVPVHLEPRWSEVGAGVFVARAFGLTITIVCQDAAAFVWRITLPGGPALAGRARSRAEAEAAALSVARSAAMKAIEDEADLEAERRFLAEQRALDRVRAS